MNRVFAIAAVSLAAFSSCRSLSKQAQLEAVAKDWCTTIRASQVMPVYPLTEDLQPGDVFLVQLPINEQQDAWKRKGFLSLDNHVARLDPLGYHEFYDHSFIPRVDPTPVPSPDPWLPQGWQSAMPATPATPSGTAAWSKAPRAAFPTYSFSVKKSGGVNLAIPISGVPVGLSVLGSDAAEGAVSMSNARTLGIDQASLLTSLETWAEDHRPYLSNFAPSGDRVNYLRIVNRIYLVGEVAISMRDASLRSAGVDVAEPKPVSALVAEPPNDAGTTGAAAAKNYDNAVKALNDSLVPAAGALPGGSMRFTGVSARTVSMAETFDPPLVIGYLGFDVAITEFGFLGPPVPTFSVLDYGLAPAVAATSPSQLIAGARMQTVVRALKELSGNGDPAAKDLLAKCNQLGDLVPPQWPCPTYDSEGKVAHKGGSKLRDTPPTFENVSSFRGGLIQSIANLANLWDAGTFILEDGPSGEEAKAFIESRLAMTRAELQWLNERLERHAQLLAEADLYTAPYRQKN